MSPVSAKSRKVEILDLCLIPAESLPSLVLGLQFPILLKDQSKFLERLCSPSNVILAHHTEVQLFQLCGLSPFLSSLQRQPGPSGELYAVPGY